VSTIQLSPRQFEILQLVQREAPITGELIAERLGVSRTTIRADLSLLVMLGHLDAKPKVGYFPGKNHSQRSLNIDVRVQDVMMMPVVVRDHATINDAIVALFIGNTGTVFVIDDDGLLVGVLTSKDLLKVTFGNPNAASMPVNVAMTRTPNVVTVAADEYIWDAARKLIEHQIDSLPVVAEKADANGTGGLEVIGRVTKTAIIKTMLKYAADS
jgi:CBS domain-containing protein